MRYVFLLILTNILFTSCVQITSTLSKNNIIIKYYQNIKNNWTDLNYKHIFLKSITNAKGKAYIQSFDPVVGDVENMIYKVYYRDEQSYRKNIPFKAERYVTKNNPDATFAYDKQGRVIEEIYYWNNSKVTYKYKKNKKIKSTLSLTTKNPLVSIYIYNKKQKLLKICEYENGKQYTTYKLDKKNNDVLKEYDMNDKFTGNVIMI